MNKQQHRLALTLLLGACLGAGLTAWLADSDAAGPAGIQPAQDSNEKRDILYWVAPMDPDYRRDGPGKSPMGMDLVPVYADAGRAPAQGSEPGLGISASMRNAIGVKSAAVARRPLSVAFQAPALVVPDAESLAHIHVRTAGWVEELRASSEGQRVAEGDVLFTIYSPALVSAQEEFLRAIEGARPGLERAGVERLRSLGMQPAQIDALRRNGSARLLFELRAPRAGVLLELNIREGMYVEPGTVIMSIADLSRVWVEADLFPEQLAQVAEGETVRLVDSTGVTRSAPIDYLYPTIDPVTRTGRLRLRLDNPDGALRPGQYLRAHVTGERRESALAVPSTALIRRGGSTRVILDLGDGRFRPAEVHTGLETASHTEILHGLHEGERVVTSAQFLIDSEASLEPALTRMLDSGKDADPHAGHAPHQHGSGAQP
jgi:Cu(I)/Ag(I) efflux system membrane fusion protein